MHRYLYLVSIEPQINFWNHCVTSIQESSASQPYQIYLNLPAQGQQLGTKLGTILLKLCKPQQIKSSSTSKIWLRPASSGTAIVSLNAFKNISQKHCDADHNNNSHNVKTYHDKFYTMCVLISLLLTIWHQCFSKKLMNLHLAK